MLFRSKDLNFASKFTNRFKVEAVYKFHETEFKKYKQVVLIGRKKGNLVEEPEVANALYEKLMNIDELELLPMNYSGKKIKINPSSSKAISIFQTMAINKA